MQHVIWFIRIYCCKKLYKKGGVMYITQVIGREMIDARGKPTIACFITLNNGQVVQAHVSLDHNRYECMDVYAALNVINQHLAPLLMGKEPCLVSMDMLILSDTAFVHKGYISNSALLATSIAVAKAQAVMEELHPYELFAQLCEYDTVTLPFAMVNLINGGTSTHGHISVQEFLIMPVGAFNFRASVEMIQAVFSACEAILNERKIFFGIGNDGGYSLANASTREILDLIVSAIDRVRLTDSIAIALDIAAGNLYNQDTHTYTLDGITMTQDELIAWYQQLCNDYPIYALEDPLAPTAYKGWQEIMGTLSDRVQIVSDTFCAGDPAHINYVIEHTLANTCAITPADMATMTQVLQTIKLCRQADMPMVLVSHFVDTTDSLLADLVVGTSLGHIKSGGILRADAVAHYNRLFAIEDDLMDQLLEQT